MKIDFDSLSKSLVFYTVALALAISYINGKDLVLSARSPTIGYVIAIGVAFLLGYRLFAIIRSRCRKDSGA